MRMVVVGLACLGAGTLYAQGANYNRGDQVQVQSASGELASPPVQRVVAVPGDRVRVEKTSLYVNDKLVDGLSPELVATIGRWEPQVVPAGHYVVMGEEKHDHSTVRSGSLVPGKRILGLVTAAKPK
jgi:signal peptidase I